METWDLEQPDGTRETWMRDQPGGALRLLYYNGLHPRADLHSIDELAELAAARLCLERDTRVLYPGAFRYSPLTGRPLPPPQGADSGTWLPPCGRGQTPDHQGLPGLRQTHVDLALPRTLAPDQDPPGGLPLPPPGDYHFVVGSFASRRASLIAIEPRKGLLYLYRDARRAWAELRGEPRLLPESALPGAHWGLACPDPRRRTLCLPTERGLALLALDLFSLAYEVRLVPGRCRGAPVCVPGQGVAVPVMADGEAGGVLCVDLLEPARAWLLPLPVAALAEPFGVPLVEQRRIIWLSRRGQLILRCEDAAVRPTAEVIAWPPGFQPCFQFGSPYRARNGVLWQLGFDDEAGRYAYLTLASPQPERQDTACPRFGSGTVNFTLETQLRSHPWLDPESGCDADARHVVVPLLESPSRSAVCIRIPWHQGVERLFASPVRHGTVFRLVTDQGDIDFFFAKLAHPWLTRCFVYRGWLYLYHPDCDRPMPGWPLVSAKR